VETRAIKYLLHFGYAGRTHEDPAAFDLQGAQGVVSGTSVPGPSTHVKYIEHDVQRSREGGRSDQYAGRKREDPGKGDVPERVGLES
jgi:hypothetical protein